jgi:predicted metal-dependent peptidase
MRTKHGKDLMQDTRARLILARPFFGFPAMNLDLVSDESHDTAYTDGATLGFNPAFVESLTDDERQGLIAHETAHCMLGHVFRRQGRDHQIWNMACDHVANLILQENGFQLPAGGLCDARYANMPAEAVYDLLQADPQNQPQEAPDDLRDAKTKPGADGQPETPDVQEAKWKTSIVQAHQIAKGYGRLHWFPSTLPCFRAIVGTCGAVSICHRSNENRGAN